MSIRPSALTQTFLHEMGHAAAAEFYGFGVKRFLVGSEYAILRKFMFKGCSCEIGLPLMGGKVIENDLRYAPNLHIRIYAAAGLTLNFIVAFVAYVVHRHHTFNGHFREFSFGLSIFTALMVIVDGFPFRCKEYVSDGCAIICPNTYREVAKLRKLVSVEAL